MFDTRPLETVNSVIVLFAASMFPLMGVVFMIMGVAIDEPEALRTFGAMGCCSLIGGTFVMFGMLALFRWSRTGKARPFLEAIRDRLGGGEVKTATFLLSLVSPRLEGSVDGVPYSLSLRRQAGILSSSEVGAGGFGWSYTVRIPANVGAKIGFGGMGGSIASGLVGLTHATQANGMTVWTGGTPRGHQLAEYLSRQDGVRHITEYGSPSALLTIGPSMITIYARVPAHVSPDGLSSLLREAAKVARVVESA